jgi:hypothetical protein
MFIQQHGYSLRTGLKFDGYDLPKKIFFMSFLRFTMGNGRFENWCECGIFDKSFMLRWVLSTLFFKIFRGASPPWPP